MPSRVIHIRLEDSTLLGCHDIVKQGGKDVTNLPLSTVVRITIEALVRKMQQSDHIPIYDKDNLAKRLMELQIAMADPEIPFSPTELFEGEEESEDTSLSALALEVARQIEGEGEPDIKQEVVISDVDIKPMPQMTLNIFKQDSKTFEEFNRLAPKDRFVEWAIETNSDVVKKAVAICYTNLSSDLWGSEEAQAIIENLYKMHDPKITQDEPAS